MKIYNLNCEVLTPIHIGDGTELYPYEYVIKENYFHKIPLENFVLELPPEKQAEITRLMEEDIIKLRHFLKDNFEPQKDKPDFSIEVSSTVKNAYNTKIASDLNQLLVYPFVRTLENLYIPGSSLKGAIRTAVLAYFTQRDFKSSRPLDPEPKILGYGYYNKRRKFKINLQNDPFRAIKITDSLLPTNSTIIDEVATITKRGKIKTTREIIRSELSGNTVKFDTELRIDDELFDKNLKIRKKLSIDTIAKACNKFYRDTVIPSEKKYFHNNPETIEVYNQICKANLDNNSFLLRLGWGSGKDSVTLNLKKQRPEYIKTRKLINEYPLGWLKISFLEKKNV